MEVEAKETGRRGRITPDKLEAKPNDELVSARKPALVHEMLWGIDAELAGSMYMYVCMYSVLYVRGPSINDQS